MLLKLARGHVIISGQVQGVFFRSNTVRKAKELSLRGWIKNLENGDVEAVFEGEEENVNKMVDWCKTGPETARVSVIKINLGRYLGEFKDFSWK